MTADVRVVSCNQSGTPFGEVTGARVTEMIDELNRAGSAKIGIDPLHPSAPLLKVNEREVQIWIDDVLRWWGIPRSISGDTKEVFFNCAGLLDHFAYRFVTASLLYTSIDQLTIGSNLITYAQTGTNRNRNVTFPTITPSGRVRSREYKRDEHGKILTQLEEFPELDDGFDFSIEVFGDGRREWTPHYPLKGSVKAQYALETGRNIDELSYEEKGEEQATQVYATGGSNGTVRFEENYENTTLSATYGQMQRAISEGTQQDVAWLQAKARAEVDTYGTPVKLPEITVNNSLVQLDGNLKTGDQIPVRIDHGIIQFNENLRINRINRLEDGRLKLSLARP